MRNAGRERIPAPFPFPSSSIIVSMKKSKTFKEAAATELRRRGYEAHPTDIQRAQWRQQKQRRSGTCPHAAADYLIFNRIARPTHS